MGRWPSSVGSWRHLLAVACWGWLQVFVLAVLEVFVLEAAVLAAVVLAAFALAQRRAASSPRGWRARDQPAA